jgi:hypothetical protein
MKLKNNKCSEVKISFRLGLGDLACTTKIILFFQINLDLLLLFIVVMTELFIMGPEGISIYGTCQMARLKLGLDKTIFNSEKFGD